MQMREDVEQITEQQSLAVMKNMIRTSVEKIRRNR